MKHNSLCFVKYAVYFKDICVANPKYFNSCTILFVYKPFFSLPTPSLLTAPSPVENIQVLVKAETIHVSWLPGAGNVDQYGLVLLDKDGPVQQTDLEKHYLAYNFSGLTPGRLYNLTVISKAAGLENYNFRLIRTGKVLQIFP